MPHYRFKTPHWNGERLIEKDEVVFYPADAIVPGGTIALDEEAPAETPVEKMSVEELRDALSKRNGENPPDGLSKKDLVDMLTKGATMKQLTAKA